MADTTNNIQTTIKTTPEASNLSTLTFSLTVRNRKMVVFEGDIKAISSLNDRGKFDILPHHGNLISLIKEYLTIYKIDGTKQTIQIQNGIIYVRRSAAHCYIDLLSGTENSTNQSLTNKADVTR